MSPPFTRAVASTSSRTGERTERDRSSVSSNDNVNATNTATTTSSPRSFSEPRWCCERPLTTTPVITLISGRAPSSFQRSGTPEPRSANSGGSWSAMSCTTGRSASSEPKKCSTAAYATETSAAANRISTEYAGRSSSSVMKIETGAATSTTGSQAPCVTNSTGSEIAVRHASGAPSCERGPLAQSISGRALRANFHVPTASDTPTHAHENSTMTQNSPKPTFSYSVSRPSVPTTIRNADTTSKPA